MVDDITGVKKTPLFEVHKNLGARIIDFGGWLMPVQYSGILEEHRRVRSSAGLFDVSHMGEIEFKGKDALSIVQKLTTNDVSQLRDGEIQYSVFCYPDGGIVDDLTVYRFNKDHFMFCVNASNTEKDYDWIIKNSNGDVEIKNISSEIGQIALQGPRSQEILSKLTKIELNNLRYYWFVEGEVAGIKAIISRTGYTGEDGFELYIPPESACYLWNELMKEGNEYGVTPVGLGARDTLRMEMKYVLYGNDIDKTTSPLEAGLGWITKLDKGYFIGRDTLAGQKSKGINRKLIGFEMVDRAIARHTYTILKDGRVTGRVTSGSYSPSLGRNVGIGYVEIGNSSVGTEIDVDVRGKTQRAIVVKTPFLKSRVRDH